MVTVDLIAHWYLRHAVVAGDQEYSIAVIATFAVGIEEATQGIIQV